MMRARLAILASIVPERHHASSTDLSPFRSRNGLSLIELLNHISVTSAGIH